MSITPHASVSRIQPLAAQSNPPDSLGNPRGSALLPCHPVWTGQDVKPQPPTPPPCLRGFIEGDLLMKTRPQSPSVWSSLPETGVSFTALSPFQSCHCNIHPAVPDAAPRWDRVYFKVTGALCKQSRSVGDQRQTPHPAPRSGGVGKPKPPGQHGCG